MKKEKNSQTIQLSNREAGNVLFYILLCVALLALLTYTMSSGGNEQATGTTSFKLTEDIKSQAQGIRSAILECVLVQNAAYPLQPVSGNLNDVECAMASGGNQNLFTAQSARALPIPPGPFNAWTYTNVGNTFIKASLTVPSNRASSQTVRNVLSGLADAYHVTETSPGNHIYQNQEICIIETGTEAEFHVCIKSNTGVCGKVAPNNQSVSDSPCDP
jgi:hypothetical protein